MSTAVDVETFRPSNFIFPELLFFFKRIMTPMHELTAVPDYVSAQAEAVALVHHAASTLASTEIRPWGSFSILEESGGYKIKRIEVKPKHRLSLQMHHHRSEHWIVVSGTAKVVCGNDEIILYTNQSTYVPPCTNHRLENPGVIPLILIEVQNGEYLGEDDIVRFHDDYARVQGS
ncbi:MAG TPA: phosphomannose isomerase type II C-terminal cupin domain [Crinalium sp.]